MTDSDLYLPSASSNERCDTSYSSDTEEMEVASTVQPYEGEPRASKKISTKTDKGGFSPAVFRLILEQKTPVTEYLVFCVCVLFSMAKSMLRVGSVFVSVAITFHSFVLSAAKVPLAQCSRVWLM